MTLTQPEDPVSMSVSTQQLQNDLMALPLEDLLRYWQRLNWWTEVWPLFRHLVEMDLSLPEIVVLRILVRRSPNVMELAQSISLSQSAASRVVDRLVDNGLISRQEDPNDRRNKRLTLTPEGLARIEEIEQVFGREFKDLTAILSPSEQDQLRILFSRLLAGYVARHEGEAERTEWTRELGGATFDAQRPK